MIEEHWCLQMPMSMAEAGAERERKERNAMSLREKIGKGECETLRFGGNEDCAVMVDKVPVKELRAETVAGNGIVIALLFPICLFGCCSFGSDCFFFRYATMFPHLHFSCVEIINIKYFVKICQIKSKIDVLWHEEIKCIII